MKSEKHNFKPPKKVILHGFKSRKVKRPVSRREKAIKEGRLISLDELLKEKYNGLGKIIIKVNEGLFHVKEDGGEERVTDYYWCGACNGAVYGKREPKFNRHPRQIITGDNYHQLSNLKQVFNQTCSICGSNLSHYERMYS